ncbi:MAG: WxL domain-containing protein [Actinomycetia bacterium]|nr:WxL domain-containing protein [Actinomycetes bacterium]
MTATTKKKALLAVVPAVASALLMLALSPAQVFADDDPQMNTEATVVFTAGDITMESAPNMDFGSQVLSNQAEDYDLTASGAPLQVSDLRGTAAGWKVTAALGAFRLNGIGDQTLTGSCITIGDMNISAANDTIGVAPLFSDDPVVLYSGGASEELLNAEEDSGAGVWNAALDTTKTQLTVYPGAVLGTHKAEMIWTLEAVPA